jgi:hypothetical protein
VTISAAVSAVAVAFWMTQVTPLRRRVMIGKHRGGFQ